MFYVFQILKVSDNLFLIATITVCLIATAYIGEIIRSGIESINQTQWDAAEAMNFSYEKCVFEKNAFSSQKNRHFCKKNKTFQKQSTNCN